MYQVAIRPDRSALTARHFDTRIRSRSVYFEKEYVHQMHRSPRSLSAGNLSFSYSGKPIFKDFSIALEPGRTVLLGPNGAGKSTLLSILASTLPPRRGHVTLSLPSDNDASYASRKYRSHIAWLPQEIYPMPGLSVREHVAYSGWLKGMSRRDAWRESLDALAAVDLQSMADRRSTQLSGGQTRRMALAGSLVHNADVILLDEPTAGLDPMQREHFREILASLPNDIVTVVSTHQTEDLVESYNTAIVLAGGSVRFKGSVSELVAGEASGLPMRDRVALAYGRLVGTEA